MKGQFFIITAVVIISFLLFISFFINQYPSPGSSFHSKNDIFLVSNLLNEIQFLIENGLVSDIGNFSDFVNSNLGGLGYDLNGSYGYSPISGETDIELEPQGSISSAKDVYQTNYICNNYNRTASFDLYWNACMKDSMADVITNKECNIALEPFECYESSLFVHNMPPNRDLITFTANNELGNEIMNICIYTGDDELSYSNESTGLFVSFNLSSEDSSFNINSLYGTPYCLEHCIREDVSSC